MNRKQRRAGATQGADLYQALYNQGIEQYNSLRLVDAAATFKQILIANPRHADSLHMLGVISIQGENLDVAEALIREAIAIKNDDPYYHNNIACIYRTQQKLDLAVEHMRQSIALKPDYGEALSNLAGLLKTQGKLDEAIAWYKKALHIQPKNAMTYSNMLLSMIYAASVSPEELTDALRAFGDRIANPLLRVRPFTNNRDPERRLRIGYVSPDFSNHAVNYFFEPLLTLHDRTQFEILAYSNRVPEDHVTRRLKGKFDHWRPIPLLTDDDAADLIEADKIDILVDLAGHTANNRLLTFARKPAPIQVTWLGYPATSGMKAMDYRISDHYAEPEGMTEHLNVETLWRLPHMFCCYQAHENSPAVIDHPPFEDNGYITFGCFNNFAKVTDPVLESWAEIMAKVPESRLLLEISGIDSPRHREEVEARLRAQKLPMDRVILEPRQKSNQFVLYNKIDIALDPFPCTGGTTSMDTLWMGVPFVTLAGRHFVSRMGVSILTNAGLPELIAHSMDQYVDIAATLANNRDRLRQVRHRLRERTQKSPVMDQARFARNMESAYRAMWCRYVS